MRLRHTIYAMLILLVIVLAVVAIPMFIIQPFRSQSATNLQLALWLRHWGPWVASICAMLAVVLAWRSRQWQAIGFAILPIAAAVLSFVNIFEIMFHPVLNPAFAAAKEAGIEDDDMVLAVNLGTEARAYPVRMLAYHHIVNDRIGGVPIVATY